MCIISVRESVRRCILSVSVCVCIIGVRKSVCRCVLSVCVCVHYWCEGECM